MEGQDKKERRERERGSMNGDVLKAPHRCIDNPKSCKKN